MSEAKGRLAAAFGGAVVATAAGVEISDPNVLVSEAMDRLVWSAVFGSAEEQAAARALIWDLGQAVGVRPASIHDLYLARGRGECGGFTVPAINGW